MSTQNHSAWLEISLDNLRHNYQYFRSKLAPNVKLLCMVKANAYGSGLHLPIELEKLGIDYLGVALNSEAIALREAGIRIPIMVINSDLTELKSVLEYDLEPEIFNLTQLKFLANKVGSRKCSIHLKVETGMNRLGFQPEDIPEAITILNDHPTIKVLSVFSHFAASEDPKEDTYSINQVKELKNVCDLIKYQTNSLPFAHICNSSGILRFPEYHFDMVRLGIGIHGVGVSEPYLSELKPLETLKARIAHIHLVEGDDTIGYNRTGKVVGRSRIATLSIGYGDGLRRNLSNGRGKVYVNGKFASIVGRVCMDLTMIDITGIEAFVGDEVEIFGEHISVDELAKSIGTISYEILTGISARVSRVLM